MDDQRPDWDDLPIDPDLIQAQPTPASRPRRRDGRADPRVLAAISLGAMPGAAARYGMSRLITVPVGRFPWATFWTNVSGAFVLGLLLVLLIERFPPTRYARAFAGTGFLGAYTTFSTFSVEADLLVKDGHPTTAAFYVAASLVVGVTVAWLGVTTARLIPHQRRRRGEEHA